MESVNQNPKSKVECESQISLEPAARELKIQMVTEIEGQRPKYPESQRAREPDCIRAREPHSWGVREPKKIP